MQHPSPPDSRTYSIAEATKLMGYKSPDSVYDLVRSGALPSVKRGRTTRVDAVTVDIYADLRTNGLTISGLADLCGERHSVIRRRVYKNEIAHVRVGTVIYISREECDRVHEYYKALRSVKTPLSPTILRFYRVAGDRFAHTGHVIGHYLSRGDEVTTAAYLSLLHAHVAELAEALRSEDAPATASAVCQSMFDLLAIAENEHIELRTALVAELRCRDQQESLPNE